MRIKRQILFRFIAMLLLVTPIFSLFSACDYTPYRYREIGIPHNKHYSAGSSANCAWDMIYYGDNLYVGGGDYNINVGSMPIMTYSETKNKWETVYTADDEEINRFLIIDGNLTVPGVDATEDWLLGNYYVLRDDGFIKYRNIPGAIHVFDMVKFDGQFFVGIGVEAGGYPVLCSGDGGTTFTPCIFEKNGFPINTQSDKQIRTHDFFVHDNALYATLYIYNENRNEAIYELYRYEDGRFYYHMTLLGNIHRIDINRMILSGKASYKGYTYLTTGYLYYTDTMESFVRITMPAYENAVFYDILVEDGVLYCLAATKNSGETPDYTVTVLENTTGEPDHFSEVFSFTYDLPPISFAKAGDTYYIGMGEKNGTHEKNGMILQLAP